MKKIYQLISRSTLIALCAVSFSMFSCEGDEGPVGPKGDAGVEGPQGEQGIPGESSLSKSGYFEGTITGTNRDGEDFTETFKYEYGSSQEALSSNNQEEEGFWLARYNTPSYENGAEFELEGYVEQDGLDVGYFDFDFYKELDATTVFVFDTYYYGGESQAEFEVTNFVHNDQTGVVTFDFSYSDPEGWDNSTGNPVTITGKFNSGHKVYKNIVMRAK